MPIQSQRPAAILSVSFGTSYLQSLSAAIGGVEEAFCRAFPGHPLRRAFTSRMILQKLRERDGLAIDNVPQALERLLGEGVTRVAVQPTHFMHGVEYDRMMEQLEPYRSRFGRVAVGEPLLSCAADYQEVARRVAARFSPAADTALVLMGHGTSHFADCAYAALGYHFLENGWPNILVGTVEGYPTLEELVQNLRRLAVRRVVLTPLMVVSGDHAANDMAGPGPDSWQSRLQAEGYQVSCVLRGMGEYPEIQQLYVDHLRAAMAVLDAQSPLAL